MHLNVKLRYSLRLSLCLGLLAVLFSPQMLATTPDRLVQLRDITDIEGVRDNQLVGYGLVVGLRGTGDRQQTYFTVQTLANAMRRMGVQISPTQVTVKNVAAVFVTASLPSFVRPGMKVDVTIASVGDATSIEGGVLLMTSLRGPDGQVYAQAQGPLTLGGYSDGLAGNIRSVNHPTVARIAGGGIVERGVQVDLTQFRTVTLLLRNPDFTAARDMAAVINIEFKHPVATTLDNRTVQIDVKASGCESVPLLISQVQALQIRFRSPAKVVVNERTGTIVMGGDVTLSPVSVLHGSLSIEVETIHAVSQPSPGSFSGSAVPVTNTTMAIQDPAARAIRLENGANVDDLIRGLHAIGATSHDIVAILQAIKSSGGLQAELEVI